MARREPIITLLHKRYCPECYCLTFGSIWRWLRGYEATCWRCDNEYPSGGAYGPDYDCPKCKWPLPDDSSNDESWVSKSPTWYGYEGDMNWTEYHKCPECGTEWEFDNGT